MAFIKIHVKWQCFVKRGTLKARSAVLFRRWFFIITHLNFDVQIYSRGPWSFLTDSIYPDAHQIHFSFLASCFFRVLELYSLSSVFSLRTSFSTFDPAQNVLTVKRLPQTRFHRILFSKISLQNFIQAFIEHLLCDIPIIPYFSTCFICTDMNTLSSSQTVL